MNDPEMRDKMGKAGRDRVVKHFDYRVVAERFVGIMKDTLGIEIGQFTDYFNMESSNISQIEEAKEAATDVFLHNAHGPFQGLPRTAGWGYPEPYTRDLLSIRGNCCFGQFKELLKYPKGPGDSCEEPEGAGTYSFPGSRRPRSRCK